MSLSIICPVCGLNNNASGNRTTSEQCKSCRKLKVPSKIKVVVNRACKRHGITVTELERGPLTPAVTKSFQFITSTSTLCDAGMLENYMGIKAWRISQAISKKHRPCQ